MTHRACAACGLIRALPSRGMCHHCYFKYRCERDPSIRARQIERVRACKLNSRAGKRDKRKFRKDRDPYIEGITGEYERNPYPAGEEKARLWEMGRQERVG